MKYKFYIEVIEDIVTFGIMPEEEKYNVLFRFGDSGWTPQKIQKLIEGVEQSKNKEPDVSFDWQNEDVFFRSNKYGFFFVDLMKQRAGEKSKKQDLDLNHDEFIKFLQDFKKFVEENS
ncbi:hypothetical protein DRF60_00020 [Chryseobacterium elymi]|uniref:Uncharacterized protein n=1 Tax=Chryseobacterium elymi TaxID=395936 RepID=A0A3D9DQ77_9FLAO|nr:hypothetical protein [Chryseobacterium elymi]REC80143.1 hypothetical protein DRF60_00020 [Chryseobacterium elymi]